MVARSWARDGTEGQSLNSLTIQCAASLLVPQRSWNLSRLPHKVLKYVKSRVSAPEGVFFGLVIKLSVRGNLLHTLVSLYSLSGHV